MDAGGTPGLDLQPGRRRLGQRRKILIGSIVLAILFVGIVAIPLFNAWAPLLHWTCANETLVSHGTNVWIPAVLVNSPYGGNATGQGLMAWNFPGAWNGPPPASGQTLETGWGTNSSNGTSAGAFFTVNVSIYSVRSVIALGPGTDSQCAQSYGIALESPEQYGGISAGVRTLSNLSDKGEADNITGYPGSQGGVPTPHFANGFEGSGNAFISTCGMPGLSRPVKSNYLDVSFVLSVAGKTISVPYVLPFSDYFTYNFPANFGTWQIDNLSAPGGSGGGWAFSYSPCS
jgi:hypothetical protein